MSLQQHISHLLYHHDCIIIPGFGGFVANQRASFLNPAHHTFSPPSKRIAFNSSLRISDGLLANHISKAMDVSYKEATELIDHFVKDCMFTLNNGERLIIDKVGVLFYDGEKNLQFVPDNSVNYLKNSFGLTTIHSPAIKREEDARRTMHPIITNTSLHRTRKLKKWRLIELIPAAAVLTWLMLSPPLLNNFNLNLGTLNPFASSGIVLHSPKTDVLEEKHSYFKQEDNVSPTTSQLTVGGDSLQSDQLEESKTPAEELLSTPTATSNEASVNTKMVANADVEKGLAEPVSTDVHVSSINNSQKLSYVIGGCFLDYNNAVNYRDEALADGFQAAIIGQNERGMHMVSLFSSADNKRASSEMALIKEKFQPQAWMCRR